ncbi:helix-turn-helix domain-containing protein [Ralstonia pseudosolanacearum]
MLENGTSVSETARRFETSRQTVLRIRAAHANQDAATDQAELIMDEVSKFSRDTSVLGDGPAGA